MYGVIYPIVIEHEGLKLLRAAETKYNAPSESFRLPDASAFPDQPVDPDPGGLVRAQPVHLLPAICHQPAGGVPGPGLLMAQVQKHDHVPKAREEHHHFGAGNY